MGVEVLVCFRLINMTISSCTYQHRVPRSRQRTQQVQHSCKQVGVTRHVPVVGSLPVEREYLTTLDPRLGLNPLLEVFQLSGRT